MVRLVIHRCATNHHPLQLAATIMNIAILQFMGQVFGCVGLTCPVGLQ